ncbi:Cytochrome P469 monooxygenase [Paramyrothecium foliicola]|nr:Cytochrome P469 monooxygenase [Paramyrothecium foliicola]
MIELDVPVAAYFTSLLSSIAVYRLFFHRLRKFRGPRLAALTKLWHVWKCRYSRGHIVLEDMRRQYGSFVRTGPNEITIFHPAAFELMDGYNSPHARSDWYDLLYPRVSSIFTRNKTVHDVRRKMWDSALSSTALNEYYTRIGDHVERLTGIIEAQEGRPLAINDLIIWFAFDSMGDFGFGKDFGMLKKQDWIQGVTWMRSAMTLLGPASPAIWLARIAFAYLPGVWKVKDWFSMLKFADECMQERMKPSKVIDPLSDTSAPSLMTLLYFLARNPKDAAKIQAEIEGVDCTDVQALGKLPHLSGTINETLRLLPAILSFSERLTAPEGLKIDDVFIPGGVKICAPRYSLGRCEHLLSSCGIEWRANQCVVESAYEKPDSFVPERWYSKPEMVKDKRAFAPFGVGRTSCAGKRLAMGQMRLVAAAILSRYHIKFAPGDNGDAVERDMTDQLTANPGRLVLVFEKR